MACIKPFRGIRYNPKKIDGMEKVVTPPYDVISPEDQNLYYKNDAYNVVRLDFGKIKENDNELENRYTRAAEAFESWQKEGILLRDSKPAIYLHHISYEAQGRRLTRKGFISLVRVEDFASGVIKPHERTFPKVTADRLRLMEQCAANFSPVFSIYDDPPGETIGILENKRPHLPLFSFQDRDGFKHEMWALEDGKTLAEFGRCMEPKTLFIADGHHRYTTALEYRDKMRQGIGNWSNNQSVNHIMMYLCSMQDDGMLILPTHRLVTRKRGWSFENYMDKMLLYFEMHKVSMSGQDVSARSRFALEKLADAGKRTSAIGIYTGSDDFLLLELKNRKCLETLGREIPEPLPDLDVVILSELVFGRVMGLDDKNGGDAVSYCHDPCDIMRRAEENENDCAFLLNPTGIEQVRDVALAGLVMPHKSTYFYPKILTGLVMNKIVPEEEV
ncbi:MAG: DUF1015 domain-containing protein [Pseudomonadota bacterium]